MARSLVSGARAFRAWWERHGGVDGGIRVGGAVAVVATIELLAGYFLWRGMVELIGVPPVLGWTLQAGLAGGSAVGTRAFHRGEHEDSGWGLATSVLAVAFLVLDASVAALMLFRVFWWNPGFLAVGVLVECLVVGSLTVHTLMARPRVSGARREQEEWGPATTVTTPEQAAPVETPDPTPPKPTAVTTAPTAPRPVRPVPSTAATPAPAKRTAGKPSSQSRLRERAKAIGVPYSGKTGYRELRIAVEKAEAAKAEADEPGEPERVAA